MLNRRKFIQTVAAGTAAAFIPKTLTSCGDDVRKLENIGYITGMIRNEVRDGDWQEVFAATAGMGYTEIETGNYLGDSAQSFLSYLGSLGMKVVAGGAAFSENMDEVNSSLDRLNALEVEYAVLYWPWFGGAPLSLDDCKISADLLNRIGEMCRSRGLTLCWHNHDLEFHATKEGVIPFDYLMDNTDEQLVKCELDIYWTKKGGADPVETLRKYRGRYPLLHVKDMAPGEEETFACPGSGIIDFGTVLAEAVDQDIRHYFVEKDNVVDGLACLESAATYLKSLRF
ncbi:MAG: sugar phosphate isomerase/epimerase [Marinilabiliales bacterium]|nr:MAG: sugar phosphate isomerase/epimerase [Marinilabiliales bacterium]